MPELAARLLEQDWVAAPAMLSHFLCQGGLSCRKALIAVEFARADLRDERRVWRVHRQVRMRQGPHRPMLTDETYLSTKMTRLRGLSREGHWLRMKAPFGHWRAQTFIAGLRWGELSAPWVIEGAITRLAVDIYIETQLALALGEGDVVILDNLAVHKSKKAA